MPGAGSGSPPAGANWTLSPRSWPSSCRRPGRAGGTGDRRAGPEPAGRAGPGRGGGRGRRPGSRPSGGAGGPADRHRSETATRPRCPATTARSWRSCGPPTARCRSGRVGEELGLEVSVRGKLEPLRAKIPSSPTAAGCTNDPTGVHRTSVAAPGPDLRRTPKFRIIDGNRAQRLWLCQLPGHWQWRCARRGSTRRRAWSSRGARDTANGACGPRGEAVALRDHWPVRPGRGSGCGGRAGDGLRRPRPGGRSRVRRRACGSPRHGGAADRTGPAQPLAVLQEEALRGRAKCCSRRCWTPTGTELSSEGSRFSRTLARPVRRCRSARSAPQHLTARLDRLRALGRDPDDPGPAPRAARRLPRPARPREVPVFRHPLRAVNWPTTATVPPSRVLGPVGG